MFVPGLGCGVTAITSADQINFMPGPAFLTAFSGGGTPAYAPVLAGLTPLKEALEQARTALAGANLTGITITQRDGNGQWGGRVLSMKLVGSTGTATPSGETFRSIFGLRSTWFNLTV